MSPSLPRTAGPTLVPFTWGYTNSRKMFNLQFRRSHVGMLANDCSEILYIPSTVSFTHAQDRIAWKICWNSQLWTVTLKFLFFPNSVSNCSKIRSHKNHLLRVSSMKKIRRLNSEKQRFRTYYSLTENFSKSCYG